MPSVTITCQVPPSVNRTRGEHWAQTSKRKRRFVGDLAMLLLAARVPRPIPGDQVHATAMIVTPNRRRRDEGNYRAPLEKFLGDALCPPLGDHRHRWISDDTPEHFTFGELTFRVEPGRPARCDITLTWQDDEPEELAA